MTAYEAIKLVDTNLEKYIAAGAFCDADSNSIKVELQCTEYKLLVYDCSCVEIYIQSSLLAVAKLCQRVLSNDVECFSDSDLEVLQADFVRYTVDYNYSHLMKRDVFRNTCFIRNMARLETKSMSAAEIDEIVMNNLNAAAYIDQHRGIAAAKITEILAERVAIREIEAIEEK